MRFVVAQVGARREYAVPQILHRAGILERFYTDLAGNLGLGKWLTKYGGLMGLKRPAARLAARKVPDCIKAKTVTFGYHALKFILNSHSPHTSRNQTAQFRHQLTHSQTFGRAILAHGCGNATHLYSMLGEAGPALSGAKRHGLTTVTEMYILLSSERIVAEEQRRFPHWESLPPDWDSVRRDFPEQTALLAQTDFALCPSSTVRSDLEDNFGFPAGHAAVVPYGVNPERLRETARPVPGRVLFAGTAGLRKGIHYLAMAAEFLQRKGRRYEFRIAGDVSSSIQRHPQCQYLRFLGRLPRAGMQPEYATAEVFVLPSLAEGSAESTYEALAAGLPVITTDAAGSVVRDGIEGFLVPPRDPQALARAIETLIQDRDLGARMSAAARARARDYTFESYGRRLLAALRQT